MTATPPPSPGTLAILDPETIERLRTLQASLGAQAPDVFADLLQIFRRDALAHIAAIRTAVEASDPAGLAEAAHALKGASLTVGARALAQAAAELEESARAGAVQRTLDGAPSSDRLDALSRAALDALSTLAAQERSAG